MAADFYAVLGVAKSASADEIRKAYKKLSRENHPDRKPDDKAAAEKFKQVHEAWDVLGDAQKRQQYDQFGAAFGPNGPKFQGGQRRGGPGGAGPIDLSDLLNSGQVDLGSLFGGMFGGGGGGGAEAPFGRQAGRRTKATSSGNAARSVKWPRSVCSK